MLQYNIFGLLGVCFKNKDLIAARLRGDSIEKYSHRKMDTHPSQSIQGQVHDRLKSLFGLDPVIFALVVAVLAGFWALGVYLLYARWNVLPLWGKIFGIFGVLGFVGGSALTIATALIAPECKLEVPHDGGAGKSVGKGDDKTEQASLVSKFFH
jgi:hypothetical protein